MYLTKKEALVLKQFLEQSSVKKSFIDFSVLFEERMKHAASIADKLDLPFV